MPPRSRQRNGAHQARSRHSPRIFPDHAAFDRKRSLRSSRPRGRAQVGRHIECPVRVRDPPRIAKRGFLAFCSFFCDIRPRRRDCRLFTSCPQPRVVVSGCRSLSRGFSRGRRRVRLCCATPSRPPRVNRAVTKVRATVPKKPVAVGPWRRPSPRCRCWPPRAPTPCPLRRTRRKWRRGRINASRC